ncbi:hypothetical protein M885DRAFT_562160 [Pelagophyceae sp. CCMP2097]|nr:hypothetical protein M885DRAFT_562160 [Pelagophyceae sp. CCMP2097]
MSSRSQRSLQRLVGRTEQNWLDARNERDNQQGGGAIPNACCAAKNQELWIRLEDERPPAEAVTGNSLGAAPTETSTDSPTDAEDGVDAVRERVLKSDWRKKVASCKTNSAVVKALAAITPELDVETAKTRTRDLLTAMLLHAGVNTCDSVVLMADGWFNSDGLLDALLNNMGGLRFGVLVASDKKRGGGDINDITRGLSSTTSTIAITTAVNVAAAALNTRLLVLEEALTSREYPEDDKRFFNKKTNPVPVTKEERDFCKVFIYSALFAACDARGNEIVLGHHMLGRNKKVTLLLESMALPKAALAALKKVATGEKDAKVAVFSGSPHFGGAGVRDGFEKAEGPLQAVCKCAEAACVNADKAGDKAELLSNVKLAAAAVRGAVVAAALCPRRENLLGLFGVEAVLLCAEKGSSHEVGEAVLASVAALRGKALYEKLAAGDGDGYVTEVEAAAQSANSGNTTFRLPSLVVKDSDGITRSILNKAVAVENLSALLEIVGDLVAGLDRTKFEVNPNETADMQLLRYCAEQASKEPKEREKPQPYGVVYLATKSKTENGKKVLTAIYVGTSSQEGKTAKGALWARFKSRHADIVKGGKDGLGKEFAKVTHDVLSGELDYDKVELETFCLAVQAPTTPVPGGARTVARFVEGHGQTLGSRVCRSTHAKVRVGFEFGSNPYFKAPFRRATVPATSTPLATARPEF